MACYEIGDRDDRSWGFYEVTGFEPFYHEERCEKIINIYPKQALSLQRHEHRSEIWTVLKGRIAVILNDQTLILRKSDKLHIPKGALHSIINLGNTNAVIFEQQFGVCREDDNQRIFDYAGRETSKIDKIDPVMAHSVSNYKILIDLL